MAALEALATKCREIGLQGFEGSLLVAGGPDLPVKFVLTPTAPAQPRPQKETEPERALTEEEREKALDAKITHHTTLHGGYRTKRTRLAR